MIVLFAVDAPDAVDWCDENGIQFVDVTFVRDVEYLEGIDTAAARFYATVAFQESSAYAKAKDAYGV